jgi:hypothetical protein
MMEGAILVLRRSLLLVIAQVNLYLQTIHHINRCNLNTVLPRSYVFGVSESGDVNRDEASRKRFSYKLSIKMGRVVPDNLL